MQYGLYSLKDKGEDFIKLDHKDYGIYFGPIGDDK